jgi:alkaline phosphatase D|nr:alkaline phosphatase D family protein [Rhodoferax sp.]
MPLRPPTNGLPAGVSPTRRQLLQLATASATGLGLADRAWAQPRFASDPFKLGVASGSPTPDSVVLWTRLLQTGLFGGNSLDGQSIPVRWEMAHDAQFTDLVQSGQVLAVADLAHSVHVEPTGLAPDRWYFYRFRAGDAVSPTGRTRTFPAHHTAPERLRIAYASCQRWEHGYFSAYRHMRDENLDAVVFLGDYIYEYPAAGNAVRLPTGGWVLTLEDYRARYALHKGETELQAMHASCPWLVTWDDHEVQNDYAGMYAGENGPPVANFLARRAAAYQAFYEHMPLRSSVLTRGLAGLSSGAEMRIYDRIPFGKLATLHLLDDRQYRDRQACTPGDKPGSSRVNPDHCAIWEDERRTLLGATQEQWLDQSLQQASSGWNLICQQTLFGKRDSKTADVQSLWNDGWDGYPGARRRLTESLLKHRVANPVILGGDVHENWVGHVKANYSQPESEAIGVEFCGTSISSRGGGNALVPQRLARNPHFIFADGERRGYGVLDITAKQLTATLRVVDDVTRRDTQIETLAQFTVEAGQPAVHRTA